MAVAPAAVVVQPKLTGDAYPLQKSALPGFDLLSSSEQLKIVQRWQRLPWCAACCSCKKTGCDCNCSCDRVLNSYFEVENSANQVLYMLRITQTDKCFSCFGGCCCDKFLRMSITSADGKTLAEYEYPVRNNCKCDGDKCCGQPPPTNVFAPPGSSIGEFSHKIPCSILCAGEQYLQLRDAQKVNTIRVMPHRMTDRNMYCCEPCHCECCDPNATDTVFGGKAEFMIVGEGPSDIGTSHSYSVFSRFLDCCKSCCEPEQYTRKVVVTFPGNLDARCKVILIGAVTYATYFNSFGAWVGLNCMDTVMHEPTVAEIAAIFAGDIKQVFA